MQRTSKKKILANKRRKTGWSRAILVRLYFVVVHFVVWFFVKRTLKSQRTVPLFNPSNGKQHLSYVVAVVCWAILRTWKLFNRHNGYCLQSQNGKSDKQKANDERKKKIWEIFATSLVSVCVWSSGFYPETIFNLQSERQQFINRLGQAKTLSMCTSFCQPKKQQHCTNFIRNRKTGLFVCAFFSRFEANGWKKIHVHCFIQKVILAQRKIEKGSEAIEINRRD